MENVSLQRMNRSVEVKHSDYSLASWLHNSYKASEEWSRITVPYFLSPRLHWMKTWRSQLDYWAHRIEPNSLAIALQVAWSNLKRALCQLEHKVTLKITIWYANSQIQAHNTGVAMKCSQPRVWQLRMTLLYIKMGQNSDIVPTCRFGKSKRKGDKV